MINLLIQYLPTVLAAIMSAIVAAVTKVFTKKTDKNLTDINNEVKGRLGMMEARMNNLSLVINAANVECMELKNKINELLTELKKVEVKDDGKHDHEKL